MTQTIYKYPLQITDAQGVKMPIGATILCAQVQHGALCLWALVNPDAATDITDRQIEIVGTGNPMSEHKRRYIGTAQMAGGALVWHVFERIEEVA